MHRRLTAIYLTMLAVAAFGLAIPLCLVIVDRASTDLLLDRTADAARFASMAEQAVLTGQTESLEPELGIYSDLFGIDTVAVDADGDLVAASRPGVTLEEVQLASGESAEGASDTVMNALTGQRQGLEQRIWPWTSEHLLVAEPITDGGETIGAIVSANPTTAVARSVLWLWCVVGLSVLAILGAGVAAARPVGQWVLRPVTELGQAVEAISRGDLSTRVTEDSGPAELKQLAGAFNEMSGTISHIMERQSQFVAYAAHQIRNPLAVVRLRVEALGVQLPPQHHQAHQTVLEELDRLTRTCHGLLSLARAAETTPERIMVDPARIAQQRIDAWEPIAQHRHARLQHRIPSGLAVRALEHTVDQALDVLIDNALKFGGEGVTVHIGAERVSAVSVEITVTDDGPGIPDHLLHEAAVPFWRRYAAPAESSTQDSSGSAESVGGTGLGLSAVVALLELDGGDLQLHAVQPHGVRAVISLPAPTPPPGGRP